MATKTVKAVQDSEGMYFIPVGCFTDTEAFSLDKVDEEANIHYAEPSKRKALPPRFFC